MRIKFILIIFLALITVSSCGDDKKDEPDNPVEPVTRTWINIERDTPFRENPLLAYYEQLYNCPMWPSKVLDDSGLTGDVWDDYSYWEEHKAEAQTTEELLAMCDVPQDKLFTMSTHNLALTCFWHPYTSIYIAYNNIYQAPFFLVQANCYMELMLRLTGALELLNLYCGLEYTAEGLDSNFKLNAISIFLMTAVDFNALNKEQLARLSTEIFNKIDNIVAIDESSQMYSGKARFHYLLGAFIAYHYDEQLSDDDVELLYDFTGFQGMPGVDLATGKTFTTEDVSRSTLIISQSLERME